MTQLNGAMIDEKIDFTPRTIHCKCGKAIARCTSKESYKEAEKIQYCGFCQSMEARLVRFPRPGGLLINAI